MRYQRVPTPLITTHARIQPRVLRPVVMHAVREYLPLTENWIYEQIRQASGFFPLVVCDERSNTADFPLADIHAADERKLSGAIDFVNKVHRRLAYANWPGSYRGVVKRYHPQLIHAHFGDRGVLMLGTAMKYNIPMVTTFYGYDVSKLPLEEKWVPRLKWLFEHGDLFLAEGPCLRQKLIEIGCPPEKARVHHLGVDVRHIPFQARTAPDGPVKVLMAASFREKKGLRYGLEAFARVANRRKGQLQLTIIGDGPLKQELRDLAKEYGVQHQIRWLGYQPHDVFLKEALESHLFISPSVVASDGDTEGGAPVAIIEAQATGLPILATTHADIPEVTRPGKSAFLVPERDVEALEERLEYLLDHPEIWASMGAAGRKYVQNEFNAAEQGKRLEAIYREVMRRGR
jgi:colanic acid/amylovoran biosynthesis glycosyltransferase